MQANKLLDNKNVLKNIQSNAQSGVSAVQPYIWKADISYLYGLSTVQT